MSKNMSRRSFVKQSTALSATALVGSDLIFNTKEARQQGRNVVSVITGEDYVENTTAAVRQLGGMGRFVPEGSKVAVLANPQRPNPGAFTRPDIVRSVVQMCKDVGADQVACVSWQPEQSWEQTGTAEAVVDAGGELAIVNLRDESLFEPTPVPNGVALQEARVMKVLGDYDVLISVPITKDHAGNLFTGTLKNLMGLNSPVSNREFHMENWTTDAGAIAHLDQCIADLNTIIRPDLCVVDATEFITTNGPFGPGELIAPQKIVAGTDRVAIDAYCCGLWGLNPQDILTITKAHEHGLGEIDLSRVEVLEG